MYILAGVCSIRCLVRLMFFFFFFFQAEDGIRDRDVTGVQTCALPIAFLFRGKVTNNHSASAAVAPQPQKSIAVLPFLDLTEEMNQESFADGMTEELIDKLSRIPGLRVPPPTSSFYFKGKLWPRSHGT